eukprot:CAMPEP_0118921890 /NCGR_PEP_ID=MMETSP1169-20130426/1025_1 /TAXON_ID=36882 /ORGANISM="Pyramimonas obovata, Strain CCMP722" /LENGTH=32 /DNA_ID= /DNA_START= /DNA_END= /DNA_ORIENTATION=
MTKYNILVAEGVVKLLADSVVAREKVGRNMRK